MVRKLTGWPGRSRRPASSMRPFCSRLLTLDEEKYWGYDIQYNEAGDVLLSIKEAPTLARTPGKPLEGVTVMIDPGHGNYDCGAYGAAGL